MFEATMRKLFLFYLFLYETYSAVYVKAPCPKDLTIKNFNVSTYLNGTWYEIARFPNNLEQKGDCVTITITSVDGDRYNFIISEVSHGHLFNITGYYSIDSSDNNTGVFYGHAPQIKEDQFDQSFPVHILATDYNNYGIGYECRYDEKTKTRNDFAWITSRTKKLGASTKATVDEFLKSVDYMDTSKFIWDHFSEEACEVKS